MSLSAPDARAASDNKGSQRVIEEVIVTAQKREERLQDVPISISVVGGADLDKSTAEGVTEALSSVPGVATSVVFLGGATRVAIRGVAAGNVLLAGSSPVAYYLDSVPFGLVKTAIAPDSNAYDMSRVEVLRGPQGTLYGANALNGVIRVLTEDAHLDEFEFKARTSASGTHGGGENYRGDAALNVPIVEGKLAARAVVGYQEMGGWIDRPTGEDANDAEVQNYRLKLNAQPTEALSIALSAWSSRAEYGAPPTSPDGLQNPATLDESIDSDYDVYGFKLGYKGGGFSVQSATGYLKYENASTLDLSAPIDVALPLVTVFESEVFSQEVIVASEGSDSWIWSIGGFYRDGEDRSAQTILDIVGVDYGDASESYAAFGQFGRRFAGNRWEWGLGLRYFHDDVLHRQNSLDVGQPAGTPLRHVESSFHATTPRAVLTWYPTDDLTAYVSYSEGFRSGSPQNHATLDAAPGFAPLEPDQLQNYEIGTKFLAPDGHFSLEAAVYYISWDDVQQQVELFLPGNPLPVVALINVASASGFGVDFGIGTRPTDGLELGLNVSWNDLNSDETVFSAGGQLFREGDRLNFSPEYTIGASVDYAFPLGRSGLEGRLSASGNYVSEQAQRTVVAGEQQSGFGDNMLIARLSASIHADRWGVTLFADNINDEDGAAVRDPSPSVDEWSLRVRPRTVGVQLEYSF